MNRHSPAVPFRADGPGGSEYARAIIDGVIRLEGEDLILEFVETRTGVPGSNTTTRASDVIVRRIPLEHLDSLGFARAWFRGGRIELRVRRLDVLGGLVGPGETQVSLRIDRKDAFLARDFVASVNLASAERALRDAEDDAR